MVRFEVNRKLYGGVPIDGDDLKVKRAACAMGGQAVNATAVCRLVRHTAVITSVIEMANPGQNGLV